MRRRDFLAASGGMALAGTLGGLSGAWAQAKPSQMSVMTWGGQFGEAVARGADKQFEAEFGVRMVQDRGSTPVERITRAKINASNQIFDILQLHDGLVPLAVQQDVYEKLDLNSPRLPNARKLIGGFGNDYWLPWIFSEIGICYNTKEVKNPPTKFADLWRPEFEGRVVLPAITHSIGPYVIPIGAIAAGKEENDEEAGFAQLKTLAELDPIWARDTDGIMNAMGSGEAVVGLLYRSQTNTVLQRGASVKWIAPEEGAIAVAWGAGITKGCKNPELAESYLNTLIGPKCQAVFAETFNYSGTNPDSLALLSPELQERVKPVPAIMEKLRKLDHGFIATRRAAWTDRWNRVVSG